MSEYIRQFAYTSRRSRRYKNSFIIVAKHLEALEKSIGKELHSNHFDDRMMEEFIYYLKQSQKGYKGSTLSGYGQKLGQMLKRAKLDGYAVDLRFMAYGLPKAETAAVALSIEEIERIYTCKKLTDAQQRVRDLFVFNCFTGLRFSDLIRIEEMNLINGIIEIRTKKTNVVVQLPAAKKVLEILDRNGGGLPKIPSQQSYSKTLKLLCKKAGICNKILIERHEGTRFVRKNVPKWKLIGAHTARRSFATNAYLAGIPTARIMLLTGHTTEASLFQYIRIRKKENAQILSEHPFFK